MFSIQCLQYDSIEKATTISSKLMIPRLQSANLGVVFLHLRYNDLRHKNVDTFLLTEHYKSIIEQCLSKLPSQLCLSLLPTSCGYSKINKITAEFNHSIAKAYNDIVYAKPETMKRLFLEEGQFSEKGIGEKCTMIETFQPNGPVSKSPGVMKIPVI